MMNQKLSKKPIKVEAYYKMCIFPRPPKVLGKGENTYGITLWEISTILENPDDMEIEEDITVIGTFDEPIKNPDLPFTLLLKPVMNKTYGLQYELIYITQVVKIQNKEDGKIFLKHILTKTQIENLYARYDDPIPYIANHDVEALKKVKGIKDATALRIIYKYENNKDRSPIYVELDRYGLTQTMINKLILKYQKIEDVVEIVKNHPYELSYDVDGIGFVKADNIALKGGISPKSPERIGAFIVYYLQDLAENRGCSYTSAIDVLRAVYDYFGGKDEILETITTPEGDSISNVGYAIKLLQERGQLVVEDGENKARRRVYLTRYYNLELTISEELKRILNSVNPIKYDGWEEDVAKLEERLGFSFDKTQKEGIHLALQKQLCLICGLAGSGKSTLVSGVLAAMKSAVNKQILKGYRKPDNPFTFAQCALSGKAAARLQEVTGVEGQTIHRLLDIRGKDTFRVHILPYDVIILDEISLVGGELFLQLLRCIGPHTKLIMLGDLGQLPSIGSLNLAADFYASPTIPTVELTTIHRQAAKSGIITASHEVRNQMQLFDNDYDGEMTIGELQDMTLDIYPTGTSSVVGAFLPWFKKYYESDLVNKDILKIQAISPVKTRGDTCVRALNQIIQEYVNPLKAGEDFVSINAYEHIHKHDKVMCIKNDYHVTSAITGATVSIYNGWVGIVEKMDMDYIYVNFPLAKDVIMVDRGSQELTLGYASTVHKLQGSDAPVIIGVIDYSTPPQMLDNSLLYTLITRAKKHCVIIGSNGAIRQAIATNHVSEKVTFMCEFLE